MEQIGLITELGYKIQVKLQVSNHRFIFKLVHIPEQLQYILKLEMPCKENRFLDVS